MRQLLAATALLSIAAFAAPEAVAEDADDGYAWINSCIARNMALGADDDTAHGYCACIDNQMGDAEVNDIDGWEKANPATVEACRDSVGWK